MREVTLDVDSLVSMDDEELSKRVECPPEGDPRLKNLSYSSSLLLSSCMRKYQLQKLGTNAKPHSADTQLTFDFGHAVGDAVIDLLCGKSRTEVLWNLFKSWPNNMFAENPRQKKSLAHAVYAVDSFLASREGGLLEDYELVYMADGRPAAEVSFRVNLGQGYFERGYVDLVLRNKYTGQLTIVDNKTSSARYLNSESYMNSMQALGYSVILSTLDPSHRFIDVNYTVFYLVWMTFLERWEVFEFPKTEIHRAQWLQAKLWDIDTLQRIRAQEGDYGMWPISGQSCYTWNRPCQYLGECHMATTSLMQPLREVDLEDEKYDRYGKPWDIETSLEELLGYDSDT